MCTLGVHLQYLHCAALSVNAEPTEHLEENVEHICVLSVIKNLRTEPNGATPILIQLIIWIILIVTTSPKKRPIKK
jgi:hypothetical protein